MSGGTKQGTRGPLKDLKVIDLSHIMAGPACSMLLADMGADVIKVERLPDGDDSRRMVPPIIADESAAFLIMNRNKRGIVVDLRAEAGRKVLSRLLKNADGGDLRSRDGRFVEYAFDPSRTAAHTLISRIAAAHDVVDIRVEDPKIEEVIARFYTMHGAVES